MSMTSMPGMPAVQGSLGGCAFTSALAAAGRKPPASGAGAPPARRLSASANSALAIFCTPPRTSSSAKDRALAMRGAGGTGDDKHQLVIAPADAGAVAVSGGLEAPPVVKELSILMSTLPVRSRTPSRRGSPEVDAACNNGRRLLNAACKKIGPKLRYCFR